jgi:desulfoferrodoxin-like iron-binding protein
MATKLGRRYECEDCKTIVLCLKPGQEDLVCHGKPMVEKKMEELPSGD